MSTRELTHGGLVEVESHLGHALTSEEVAAVLGVQFRSIAERRAWEECFFCLSCSGRIALRERRIPAEVAVGKDTMLGVVHKDCVNPGKLYVQPVIRTFRWTDCGQIRDLVGLNGRTASTVGAAEAGATAVENAQNQNREKSQAAAARTAPRAKQRYINKSPLARHRR